MQEKESQIIFKKDQEKTEKGEEIKAKEEKKEEKSKIIIDKKIVIKCKDIEDVKDSFDLIKVNKDYIEKISKQKPFIAPEILQKSLDEFGLEKTPKDPKEAKYCKRLKLPSGIVQIAYKINKDSKEASYETDYSKLNPKVYQKFKKNITRELDILIGNAGISFNKSPLMKNIVTNINYFQRIIESKKIK